MKKKTMYTLYGGRSPPYDNVHIGLGNEKKSTVNSYNLISYHFHTKSEGKLP